MQPTTSPLPQLSLSLFRRQRCVSPNYSASMATNVDNKKITTGQDRVMNSGLAITALSVHIPSILGLITVPAAEQCQHRDRAGNRRRVIGQRDW
ncbi:hypothetical protein GWI33_007541 [Rhynchophorus ferrugineus]|uniref:Uncharacterized protein n=1 Tax=Rhynchophorus ferrugineus TaxID=354439 RepID=A0A834IHI2_RHYFE|nr:hypothetical protein GWI33_007541 [Rhynchophorus ferrugineus]